MSSLQPFAPLTFVAGFQDERQKRFSRKVKSGCSTCKLRRVKCDETKPICNNCQRVDRDCKWLGHGQITSEPAEQRTLTKPMRHGSKATALLPSHISSRFGSFRDSAGLEKYLTFANSELAKFSNSYFWCTLVPQAGWQNESVKQAMVAVSLAYNEYHHSGATTGLVTSKPLYHYNQSIRALTRSSSDNPEEVMLCCVLFWLFENLKNRPSVALTHLRGAINILNDRKAQPRYRDDLLGAYVEPMLRDGLAFAATHLPGNDKSVVDVQSSVSTFQQDYTTTLAALLASAHAPIRDLKAATARYTRLHNALNHLQRMSISAQRPDDLDLDTLLFLYHSWKAAVVKRSQLWDQIPLRLLLLHYEVDLLAIDMLQIYFHGFKDLNLPATFRPRLFTILAEARCLAALAAQRSKQHDGASGINNVSTVPLSIIMVLSNIARGCGPEDEDIAQEALAVLKQYEFFEGIWSSSVAGEMTRLMRSAGLGKQPSSQGELAMVLGKASIG